MTDQITYNKEIDLQAPTGGILSSIMVEIEIEPADASALIYGTRPDGHIQPVQISGAKGRIELPFAHPKIYVKYLLGLKSFSISTLGWRDSIR